MIKIRSLLVFALLPLLAGYFYAQTQSKKPTTEIQVASDFNTGVVLPTDKLTLIHQGNIVSITHTETKTIATNNKQLIEVSPLKSDYIVVNKKTNYSSLEEFNQSGQRVKTLFDGNTGNIDTMNWFTDPSVSENQQEVAFVSDSDKAKTNVQDNALFIKNIQTNVITKVVEPDPHSGGITHPSWNPIHPDTITYDFYQYDSNTFNPYSVITEYNIRTHETTILTTEKQNAYQGSFSPDGKQFIFLGRNDDNTVSMYLATITGAGLTQVHTLLKGDFAYPVFSYTKNHIYYLQARGNSGYDLYEATIKNDKLINISAITTNAAILANSGFSVEKVK